MIRILQCFRNHLCPIIRVETLWRFTGHLWQRWFLKHQRICTIWHSWWPKILLISQHGINPSNTNSKNCIGRVSATPILNIYGYYKLMHDEKDTICNCDRINIAPGRQADNQNLISFNLTPVRLTMIYWNNKSVKPLNSLKKKKLCTQSETSSYETCMLLITSAPHIKHAWSKIRQSLFF